MKALVTGSHGFIGSHMVEALKAKKIKVTESDLEQGSDLRTKSICEIETCGVDQVYHFAANMGGIGYISSIGAPIIRDNVLIDTNMIEASKQNHVQRFFYASSACIYPTFLQDQSNIKGLSELDAYPALPENYYGWEKLFAEKMLEAYQRDYNLDVRIARFHNIYGPGGVWTGGKEKSVTALCRKVAEAHEGGSIEIWGDGEQTRSYCYIDDAIRGVELLMESDYDKPMNIGTEDSTSINKLADLIIKLSGKRLKKKYNLTKPQGVRGRNADISLARKVLGWEPKVSLEEGVAKTYEWIKSQVESQ